MMTHWRTRRMVLRTMLRLTIQGELSTHSSQPSAHFRHWKAESWSYRVVSAP